MTQRTRFGLDSARARRLDSTVCQGSLRHGFEALVPVLLKLPLSSFKQARKKVLGGAWKILDSKVLHFQAEAPL